MANDNSQQDTIQHITDHLMIEQTELCPADLGFIFGNGIFGDPLIEKAAWLYHQGYFKKIMVSGGVTTEGEPSEAHRIRAGLIKRGVPEDCILFEDKAMNTQQNIENSKIIIDREIGLGNVKTIIGIGQLYAARRYLQTLKKRWPEVLAMHVSVNGFPVGRDDWPRHREFRKKVLAEWRKQQTYPEKGFIIEVDIDEINAKVVRLRHRSAPGPDNPPSFNM